MKPTKNKVKCISAATRFYTTNKEYVVYTNGDGNTYIKGSDGLYDNVVKTSSKFIPVKNENKQSKIKRPSPTTVDKGPNPEETP